MPTKKGMTYKNFVGFFLKSRGFKVQSTRSVGLGIVWPWISGFLERYKILDTRFRFLGITGFGFFEEVK